MKKCFLIVLIFFNYFMYPLPPDYYSSFIPKELLEAIADQTDWPELTVEHEFRQIRHMSFSLDNKHIVLSEGTNTHYIKIKTLLPTAESQTYTIALWNFVKSFFSTEPIQVATQPENQQPQNGYVKKCFNRYKLKELIEEIICTSDGTYFLAKEKTEQLEKPVLKLIDMRDFAKFTKITIHQEQYKLLLETLETYYNEKKVWRIEHDEKSNGTLNEFPQEVQKRIRALIEPKD